MLIENMNTEERWNKVVLHLKRSEAQELRDSLDAILNDPTSGRHEHVPSEDYKREITVIISDKE